jgi:hypothetical protein
MDRPITWLAESAMIQTGADAFEAAAKALGDRVQWISSDDSYHGRFGKHDSGDVLVFRGSFQLGTTLSQMFWPDLHILGTDEHMRFSKVAASLGSRLLNSNYVLIPIGELERRWQSLQISLGGSPLFVRPDRSEKSFTGQVVLDLGRFKQREGCYLDEMDPSDLVVVALGRKDIISEYRLVVVDDEVVCGSSYRCNGGLDTSIKPPEMVTAFAQETVGILRGRPHAFMLDVAVTDDRDFHVVELNSFSCGSWYGADPELVTKAIHDLLQPVAAAV